MRILVVDDDEVHADYVTALLWRSGHSAAAVTSGRTALQRLADEPFDALIMDVVMPEMDGIELLRELKRRHAGLPVIGMTGSALGFHDGLQRLLALMGAACLLPKPLDPVALAAALRGAH